MTLTLAGFKEKVMNFNVPLGVFATLVVSASFCLSWVSNNIVFADDFERYQQKMDERMLTQQKTNIENKLLELQVKQQALPGQFNAVDRTMMQRYDQQYKEVSEELRAQHAIMNTNKKKEVRLFGIIDSPP